MNLLTTLSLMVVFVSVTAFAHDPSQHPPHNMILLGTQEVFASHIVYKQPHNYQVILQLEFDPTVQQTYLKAKKDHPGAPFIFLLDAMDIKDIAKQNSISGKLLFEDSQGNRNFILDGVSLPKNHFKVIYFDELPLSLTSDKPVK